MASQSLTAVASVVSVMKEKTVIALRINTRGCERVFYPMIVIVICCLSVACLAVAAGTPGWVKVSCNSLRILLTCGCQQVHVYIPSPKKDDM